MSEEALTPSDTPEPARETVSVGQAFRTLIVATRHDLRQWALADGAQGLRQIVCVGLYLAAFVTALIGNLISFVAVDPPTQRIPAYVPIVEVLPWWIVAFALALAAQFVVRRSDDTPLERDVSSLLRIRLGWALFSLPFLVGAYVFNAGNFFTIHGVATWFIGVGLLAWSFTPPTIRPFEAIARIWSNVWMFPVRQPLAFFTLLAILSVGLYMRVYQITEIPYDYGIDHIHKLEDAHRVWNGEYNVFFTNNGGREASHFYFINLIAQFTGGANDLAIRLASALEGWANILIVFFLGRALLPDKPRHGLILGLTLAAVAAVGWWNVAGARALVRTIMTPGVTALALIFLVRFVRHNRRQDAIWAGLVLGFGLYTYQAIRLLPLAAIAATAIGVVLVARTWAQRRAYVLNLVLMGLLTIAAFLPLLRFTMENPQLYWERVTSKLVGNLVVPVEGEDGSTEMVGLTPDEQVDTFIGNLRQLGQNFLIAMAMFTYRADLHFQYNAPTYPALDPAMAAFFYIGLAAGSVYAIRKRDPAFLLIILASLAMLLPSALAIAAPVENPSNNRASGAMPGAYLLVSIGLLASAQVIGRILPGWVRRVVMVGLVVGVLSYSAVWSFTALTGQYDYYYRVKIPAQRDMAAYIRNVIASDSAPGNVFLINLPAGWDGRAVSEHVGITPGTWLPWNVVVAELPFLMATSFQSEGELKFNPDRDVLLILTLDNTAALEELYPAYPTGVLHTINIPQPFDLPPVEFNAFQIPAVGELRFVVSMRDRGLMPFGP